MQANFQMIYTDFKCNFIFCKLYASNFDTVADANCPDGSIFRPTVNGSEWIAMNGVWVLMSCPPGYALTSEQCDICPAAFYCTGGSLPATPCGVGLYSLPGTQSISLCYPAVFVIVKAALPIFRQQFTPDIESAFRQSIAEIACVEASLVDIVGIIGNINTEITTNIATSDDDAASNIFQALSSKPGEMWSTLAGFVGASLISLEVTGCLPGFSLDESQTCKLCSANYFCLGGASSPQACPLQEFSLPGANSSIFCVQAVFITVIVSIPMSRENFTALMANEMQSALALTAAVSPGRVVVVSISVGKRGAAASIEVSLDIAADDVKTALTISQRIVPSVLYQNLALHGLSQTSLISVSVAAATDFSSEISSLAVMVGSIAGGVTMFAVLAFLLFRHGAESEEERQLRHAAEYLRFRLGITTKDGYLLNTETAFGLSSFFWCLFGTSSASCGEGQKILQRSYLNAAAQLSMLQVHWHYDFINISENTCATIKILLSFSGIRCRSI